jgi:hypothetical protein
MLFFFRGCCSRWAGGKSKKPYATDHRYKPRLTGVTKLKKVTHYCSPFVHLDCLRAYFNADFQFSNALCRMVRALVPGIHGCLQHGLFHRAG